MGPASPLSSSAPPIPASGETPFQPSPNESLNTSVSNGSTVSAESFGDEISKFNQEEPIGESYLGNQRKPVASMKRNQKFIPTTMKNPDIPSSCKAETLPNELPKKQLCLPSQLTTPSKTPSITKSTGQRDETLMKKELHGRNYFNQMAAVRIEQHGTVTVSVADTLMMLGNAHLRCREYTEALNVFKSAARMYRRIYHDGHLAVSRALNKVGIAAIRLSTDTAEEALTEALQIRVGELGPYHVDTVDSLNNLASVYTFQQKYQDALAAYNEVYLVRQAIFGLKHPSIAITAHAIGGVYVRMAQLEDAARSYQKALNIYQCLKLRADHLNVKQLLRDVAALRRVYESTGEF